MKKKERENGKMVFDDRNCEKKLRREISLLMAIPSP